MASVRYVHNQAGVGELARSEGMLAEMRRCAEVIEEIAIAIAPVDSGDYVESFRVTATKHGGAKGDRAQATVTNTSNHSTFVEFGTSRMRGQHVLLTAAVASGGLS